MAADDEREFYITHAGINTSENGEILDEWVPARYNGEFLEIERERIDYIDVTPRQVVGASASLIPYVAHDEANRALMGTHMQCQAVPLVKPEAPIIGTGMESEISEVMGRVVKAPFEGKVMQVDATKVVLEGQKGQKETFHIELSLIHI